MQLGALIIGAVTQDSLYWEPIVKALRCIHNGAAIQGTSARGALALLFEVPGQNSW